MNATNCVPSYDYFPLEIRKILKTQAVENHYRLQQWWMSHRFCRPRGFSHLQLGADQVFNTKCACDQPEEG